MQGQSQNPGQYLPIFLLEQKIGVHIWYNMGVSLEEFDKPVIDIIWDFKISKFIKQSGLADRIESLREM